MLPAGAWQNPAGRPDKVNKDKAVGMESSAAFLLSDNGETKDMAGRLRRAKK